MNRGLAGVLLATSIVAAAPACDREPELPVLATVPDFSLVDDRGRPFGGRDLEGHVVVADFIFTRCTTACPMLTAQMSNFRRRLGPRAERVRFVSFSVDPDYDTPEVLRAYAEGVGADPERWWMLTGPRATIDGLMPSFVAKNQRAEPGTAPVGEFVTHQTRLWVIDAQGRIRGIYSGESDEHLELIAARARFLEGAK